jgi:hypothetical protein
MADNLATILGIELLVAAQGIGLRTPHTASPALAAVISSNIFYPVDYMEWRYGAFKEAPPLRSSTRTIRNGSNVGHC